MKRLKRDDQRVERLEECGEGGGELVLEERIKYEARLDIKIAQYKPWLYT